MIATNEDALECDLLETYGILDYRELPPDRVALFAVGLRKNSRIKMEYNACNLDLKEQLLALLVDGVNMLIWSNSKDATKGRNRPKSLYPKLMNLEENKNVQTYKTPEDFMRAWNSL